MISSLTGLSLVYRVFDDLLQRVRITLSFHSAIIPPFSLLSTISLIFIPFLVKFYSAVKSCPFRFSNSQHISIVFYQEVEESSFFWMLLQGFCSFWWNISVGVHPIIGNRYQVEGRRSKIRGLKLYFFRLYQMFDFG